MQRNAYSSGRGQKNGYQDNHEPQTQQSVLDRWLNESERCAPWIPEDKNNDPVRDAERQRRDDIDSRKRSERREKERKDAEKRKPQNSEPRVIGDPKGLWSEPPTDHYSNPYNNTESSYQNNDSGYLYSPHNTTRSPYSDAYSNPYSTSASSHNDPHYGSKKSSTSRMNDSEAYEARYERKPRYR